MVRITFLGVGAAVPSPGRTNCAYLIEGGGETILFDCGPAILQQLAAVGRSPGEVTSVFVSHGHGDHALGWPMFRLWCALGILDRKIARVPTVVASDSTFRHLRALWAHSYADVPSQEPPALELPADRPHSFALSPNVRVSTWPMIHSDIYPVLGARFEIEGKVLSFTADSARCEHIVELGRGADLLVHDAAHALTVPPRKERQALFHCAAQDAGENAEAAGAKRLALVHISMEYEEKHAGLVAEAKTRYSGEVFAPKAGDVLTL